MARVAARSTFAARLRPAGPLRRLRLPAAKPCATDTPSPRPPAPDARPRAGQCLAPAAPQPDGADVLSFLVIHKVSCSRGYRRLMTCATPYNHKSSSGSNLGYCQLNGNICRMGLWSGTLRSLRGHFMAISGTCQHDGQRQHLQHGRCFSAHQLG
jgi:hypothetical protein